MEVFYSFAFSLAFVAMVTTALVACAMRRKPKVQRQPNITPYGYDVINRVSTTEGGLYLHPSIDGCNDYVNDSVTSNNVTPSTDKSQRQRVSNVDIADDGYDLPLFVKSAKTLPTPKRAKYHPQRSKDKCNVLIMTYGSETRISLDGKEVKSATLTREHCGVKSANKSSSLGKLNEPTPHRHVAKPILPIHSISSETRLPTNGSEAIQAENNETHLKLNNTSKPLVGLALSKHNLLDIQLNRTLLTNPNILFVNNEQLNKNEISPKELSEEDVTKEDKEANKASIQSDSSQENNVLFRVGL
ncbi:hypothetical protein BgiMline_015625 [Biomphalaria glabrata]|nr:hypothetical protein BgiMline_008446 [Biomphalaria glabrata]